MKFEYIEPYVIPKKSLTGESTERVDTRVLQVIYSFHRGNFPVYVGQQMDVFIDAGGVDKEAVAAKNGLPTGSAAHTEPAAGGDGDK